jgi:hypothetical protein
MRIAAFWKKPAIVRKCHPPRHYGTQKALGAVTAEFYRAELVIAREAR